MFNEREVLLRDFDHAPGLTFIYQYDFGDSWEHQIEFETVLALDTAPRTAFCTDGARARPPEDVGGTSGYERFLATMADPTDPDYHDTRIWCGGHFDPEWFDLDHVNRDLRNALKPNVCRRLHKPKPRRSKPSS